MTRDIDARVFAGFSLPRGETNIDWEEWEEWEDRIERERDTFLDTFIENPQLKAFLRKHADWKLDVTDEHLIIFHAAQPLKTHGLDNEQGLITIVADKADHPDVREIQAAFGRPYGLHWEINYSC